MGGKHVELQYNPSEITEESILEAISSGNFANLEELYNLVGYPGIVNLVSHYNGVTVYIPKCAAIMQANRHKRMYDYYSECRDYKQTAKAFNVTLKTVHNVIGAQRRLQQEVRG